MKTRYRHVMVVLAVCACGSLRADSGTWTNSVGGNWNDPANWEGGIIASNSGSTAILSAGTGTINNDMADPALALLGLQFAGGAYTLAGNTITLDSAGFIKTLSGDHEVQSPLALSGQTWLTAITNRTLTVSGTVSGSGGIVVNGGRVVLSNPGNSYSGQTMFQTGLLEVASIDALGDGTAPVVLGKGTFRYAGAAPADLTQGYTVLNGGGTATSVLDIRTNLTVSGKTDVPSAGGGRVLKVGSGTLTYAYPGYQIMNRGGSGINANADVVFDTVNGGAGLTGYYDYTLAEGKVVFNTPGQTNRFIGSGVIGVRYPAAAHMEIHNGVVQNPDGWFSISRGNGTTALPLSSTLTVTGGRLEISGLIMAYSASVANFSSFPVLTQTGGEIVIANDAFVPENAGGVATVKLTGGTLTDNGMGTGFDFSRGGTAGSVMSISDNSVVSLAKLRMNTGGTLNVTNGGTLALRSTASSSPGSVFFDNGTLTTYVPADQPSEWFHSTSKLAVRAGGLKANVPANQYAYLGTAPTIDAASPGGKITKSGNGTLALYNTDIPIDVNAGRLRLMGGHINTNKNAKTIALAANTALELAVPHAAEADTLSLTGSTGFELTVPNLAGRAELWQVNSAAIKRSDGKLQLTTPIGNAVGSAFMIRPVSVTNAWRADFSLAAMGGRALGSQGDGVCFVVQNDARGAAAVTTTNYTGFGYASALFQITNSFAVALDITNRRLRFGTNGVFIAQVYDLSSLPGLGADKDKTYLTVTYDGSGTISCVVTRKGMQTQPYTYAVNLQEVVGNTLAYAGFTAANTSSRYEQHWVDDVAFSTSDPAKSYGQYGGKLTLAAGQTLGVTINPAPAQNGFGLGELTYAPGSVLDIRQPNAVTPPAPTLADQGMWKLNGKANWKPDGRLAVSTNANDSPGTAFTTNLYPVAGSWTARFNYDMGLHSEAPADYITFTIQNSSPSYTGHTPNPGFAIMWRYYEGGVTTTSLRMYTNNVPVLATTNIAPVSLVNHLPAVMSVAYNAAAGTVTVITEQEVGAYTNVFSGVNMLKAVGSKQAYVGFGAFTGGLNAENIVSDFSFETSDGLSEATWQRGYLALGTATGSGTLVKKGNAALGIQDGPGNPFTNAMVRLDEGGLVLRKLVCEPITLGDDFFLSPKASWAPGGALQTMPAYTSQAGVGVTARRHTVSQAWTARFTFFMAARSGTPADGFSFFMHNDVRGPAAVGGIASGSGYEGIGNSVGLRWNFYRNSMSNTVEYGQNGAFLSATRTSHMPIALAIPNAETDMLVRHDPAAKTLAVSMNQGTNVFNTTFTNVNILAQVGDNLAYIGFGGGSGGEYCEARVKDFRFELDAPTNPLPAVACLGTAVLPAATTNTVTLDTVVSSASFVIASAQLGGGAGLTLETANANGGTLAVTNVALLGDASFQVQGGCTLALNNVSGGATLTKAGAGTLSLAGTVATYTGDTVLSAGTLSLASAVLPPATDLRVTTGATLNLPFDGKQFIHALFVNGVSMPGGVYTASNTTWITGAGRIVVTYPPSGTVILLK